MKPPRRSPRLRMVGAIIVLTAAAAYFFWALPKFSKNTIEHTRNRIAFRAPDGTPVVDSSGTHHIHSDHEVGGDAGDYITPRPCVSSKALSIEDQKAGQVVALYGPRLMKIPGVWGVQDYLESDCHIIIRVNVNVEEITPELERRIPTRLGTFRVEIYIGPPPSE
jgi:hypothetical protein